MPAYVIVQENLTGDQGPFEEYRKHVMASLEPHGGKFLVRGGTLTVLEGEWPHQRTVILEFPSRKSAEDWYLSPAYQKILPLRLNSATGNFVILDGTA